MRGKRVVTMDDFIVRVVEVDRYTRSIEGRGMYIERFWGHVNIEHPKLNKVLSVRTIRGNTPFTVYLASKLNDMVDRLEGGITVERLMQEEFEVPIKEDTGGIDLDYIKKLGNELMGQTVTV